CGRRGERYLGRCDYRSRRGFVGRWRERNPAEKWRSRRRTGAEGQTLPRKDFPIPECRRKRKPPRRRAGGRCWTRRIACSEASPAGHLPDEWILRVHREEEADRATRH